MENKFDTCDLFTNGENHRDKTPPSEFKVTTPENPLLSVRTYVNHVRNICQYRIGKSFDKTHFTYNWVDLECV